MFNKKKKIEMPFFDGLLLYTSKKETKPEIVAFNLDNKIKEKFGNSNLNICFSSLGKKVKLKNKLGYGTYCLLNHYFPPNVHEFRVFIFDLCHVETIEYDQEKHTRENITGKTAPYFFCEYPQNIFDPRPFSAVLLKPMLNDISVRDSVIIVFSDKHQRIDYNIAEETSRGADIKEQLTFSNYGFLPVDFPILNESKTGKILNLSDINQHSTIGKILTKYFDHSEYHIVFQNKTVWSSDNHREIADKQFVPLVVNDMDETVSFAYKNNKQWIFLLPDIFDKYGFINDFISTYLPEILPSLFPDNKIHSWKRENRYLLPKHEGFLIEKEKFEQEYSQKIADINKKIEDNNKEYSFLHDILTETGDELVFSVIKYLSYIGFENITDMDKSHPENKEEDIQIMEGDRLIIFEVKGIAGTSTDADCSQISKIRFRRCQQRKDFNVDAIYLVNHQRHLPPHDRKVVPFSDNQIKDAELEERSLMTTFDLYRVFSLIDNNILKKEDVRKAFLKKGFIAPADFGLIETGLVKETYKNNYIFIFDLCNARVSVGDNLVVENNNQYQINIIESIQINGKDVLEATNGEIGIGGNMPVKKNSKIYRILPKT